MGTQVAVRKVGKGGKYLPSRPSNFVSQQRHYADNTQSLPMAACMSWTDGGIQS